MMIGPVIGAFVVSAAVGSIATWIVNRVRRIRGEERRGPACRLWRLLPYGRQAVHSYCARLEDLEELPRHLGKRVYVRNLDRVYQWSIGRRGEVDGAACIYPREGVIE